MINKIKWAAEIVAEFDGWKKSRAGALSTTWNKGEKVNVDIVQEYLSLDNLLLVWQDLRATVKTKLISTHQLDHFVVARFYVYITSKDVRQSEVYSNSIVDDSEYKTMQEAALVATAKAILGISDPEML